MKNIYLYEIKLVHDNKEYYYVGIRTCKGRPEDDVDYMGSPHTHANMWKNCTSIEKTILHSVEFSEENMKNMREREIELILESQEKYGLYTEENNGHSLNVGYFPYGLAMTPEVKAKMSAAIKKHYENPEARAKQSAAIKKRYENPEERAKHSAVTKKRFENPEARAKHSAVMNRPEVKAKKSAAMNRPEVKAKLSAARKKRYENPEEKAKTSAAIKKHYENPEARAKHSAVTKKRFENPEARAKTSAAMKEYHRKKKASLG